MDLSIIIVNWNSVDSLRGCLASICPQSGSISFEVIVVDNASYDGCNEMVTREFPMVQFIQSHENRGFARACNLGYQSSTGRSLLFLNPDTKILGNALSDMVLELESREDAGAIGCKLLNGDGTLQTSCIQSFPTILNQCLDSNVLRSRYPRSRLWGMGPLFTDTDAPSPVEMVSGAALMIRRDVFVAVGGFSENYFMYGEDCDLCYRVWGAGWMVYYLPSARIIHYGGMSTKKGTQSSFSTLVMQESLKMYFAKMHGPASAMMFRATRALIAFFRLLLLTASFVISGDAESRSLCRAAAGKWLAILRWSLGMETQVHPKTAVSRSPKAGVESSEVVGDTFTKAL